MAIDEKTIGRTFDTAAREASAFAEETMDKIEAIVGADSPTLSLCREFMKMTSHILQAKTAVMLKAAKDILMKGEDDKFVKLQSDQTAKFAEAVDKHTMAAIGLALTIIEGEIVGNKVFDLLAKEYEEESKLLHSTVIKTLTLHFNRD